MSNWRTHPADTTLILAVDRELPFSRRLALDRHLLACEACRSRLQAFEEAGRAATRVCRDGTCDHAAATSALRLRLQDRMRKRETEWDRSLLFRFRRAASSVPPFARVGFTAAMLMLVVRLVQPRMNVTVPPLVSEHESLPISRFTPGATSNASARDLCSGSLPMRRVVSVAVRQQVLQQYRMEHVAPSEYELDYLITPELGGVADARNLWPERYDSGVWNARVKDDLERLLPSLICDGAVDLDLAQREIADNWIVAYKKHFRTERPIARQADLVEEDDDGIQFESKPNVATGGSALVTFQRPSLMRPAALGTQEAFLTARVRRVAW
jgi:anti-sigma factor RsiW